MHKASTKYSIPDPEDLLECPYDDTHMIRAKRMPYHLMKCRQNYRGKDYVNCPFNARHEMPAPELRHHIANCADRVIVQQDLAVAIKNSNNKGNLTIPRSSWEPPEIKEDWENDIPRFPKIGIDKKTLMEKKMIGKSTIGMTRAEKKKFYERLRVNFEREQEGLPPVEDESSDSEEEKEDNKLQEFLQRHMSSLRMPLSKPQVLQAAQLRQKSLTPTPVFTHSLLLAGIGRGKEVKAREMKSPRPGEKGNQAIQGSDQSDTAVKPSRMAANIYGSKENSPNTSVFERTMMQNEINAQPESRRLADKLKFNKGVSTGLGLGRGDSFSLFSAYLKPGGLIQNLIDKSGKGDDGNVEKEILDKSVNGHTITEEPSTKDPNVVAPDDSKDPILTDPQSTIIFGENTTANSEPEKTHFATKDTVVSVNNTEAKDGKTDNKIPVVTQSEKSEKTKVSTAKITVSKTPISEEHQEEEVPDIQGIIKKIQKKLRGIQILEEKEGGGAKLNKEEMAKVSKKEELMKQLHKLGALV